MAEESELERKCTVFVERLCDGRMVKVRAINETGFPDRLLLLPGCPAVFVEFKAKNGKLSTKQKWWKNTIKAQGSQMWVIDDYEDFMYRCIDLVDDSTLPKPRSMING